MPYPPIVRTKMSLPVTYTYELTANSDKYLFYDEVERVLCGGLRSGFGRNLDALNDVFSGGFGVLATHKDANHRVHICIRKIRLLDERVANVINSAITYSTESEFHLSIEYL